MKPIPYFLTIEVTQDDIDDLNHVNNIAYIDWMLQIAEKHWIEKTPKTVRDKYGWVVLEHHIFYKKPAFLNEVLEIKTWIENYKGVKSKRCFEICRKSDQKLIVEAHTNWCFIDLNNQKPYRISEQIVAPYFESE
ncbi:MAG: acyl-CoA thioesterase [Bacteroidota bacterium]